MGMSAGQARLLSITGRLTDNELRSQIITNSKLRLADKSSRASQEYMDALNSTKLMYGAYNDNAEKNYTALTANTLLTYGDLKNQYSLVNSSGQIMAAGSDIKKYEAASTLNEFLYSYDIAKVDNPKYAEQLKNIYGNDVDDLFDEAAYESRDTTKDYTGYTDTIDSITNSGINSLKKILETDSANITLKEGNSIIDIVSGWSTEINNIASINKLKNGSTPGTDYLSGTFGTYITTLLNRPDVDFPDRDSDEFKDITGNSLLAQKFDLGSKKCYNNAHPPYSGSGQDCYLHVLAYLADYNGDENNYPKSFDTTVGGYSISIGISKITGAAIYGQSETLDGKSYESKNLMKEVSQYIWDEKNNCMAPADKSDTTTIDSPVADKLLSNYKWVKNNETGEYEKTLKTFPERIVDTYYAVQNRNSLGLSYESLLPILDQFQTDMATALSSVFNEKRYLEAVDSWKVQMLGWLNSIEATKNQYVDSLSKIPEKKIPDKNDAKYQWYVNLWYRMGGTSETTKQNNKNNYKELDENLINNSEWLEFALEHGVLTMEQAQFSENGSKTYPGMGTYDWNSIIYTNSSDITSQQDDTAIAIAEVKYKNKITEIENQDKKFDQDLKKLDSEHNALQTEYESVKSVIDKNVERSFKAFS